MERSDSGARKRALDELFGATEVELQKRREIDAETSERFALLLAEAYRTGALEAPVAFLASLSNSDLEVIRRVQSLADPIDVGALSIEGAYNLLLPGGYKVDFNRDGLSEVGCAKTCFFPPVDAPETFRTAWVRATDGMGEQDAMVYSISLWGALHPVVSANPDFSLSETVRTDLLSTYRRLIQERLDSNEAYRALLARGQYERDKMFFTRLLEHMSHETGVCLGGDHAYVHPL